MKRNAKLVLERLNQTVAAWETLRLEKSYAGMTFAQFREAVAPSLAARARLVELETQMLATRNQLADADAQSMDVIKRVVAGVKADAEEGDDSEVYEALGYVRSSERRTGLTRIRRAPSVPLATQAA